MSQRALSFVLLFALGLVVGCGGDSGPPTATVSGVVKLDGKPLDKATITFVSQIEEFSRAATTDASGSYAMEAAVGPNKVIVSKLEGEGITGDEEEGLDEGQLEAGGVPGLEDGGAGGPKQLVPAKYLEIETTELKKDVPKEGGSDFDFDLKP